MTSWKTSPTGSATKSSTRQGESLLELRDEAEIHFKYKGLSIPILIDKCYANRFDLDGADQARVERLQRVLVGGT